VTNTGLIGRIGGFSLVAVVISWQVAFGQTAKSKSTAANAPKPGMAVWSQDVQQTLGVTEQNFNAEGLNKLTKMQLVALLTSARIDPRKQILTCPTGGTTPGGRIHVLVTVTGDDPTGAIATSIKQTVGAMNGVDLVDSPSQADKVLHLVVEKMTTGRGTIGYVASYLTATPCVSESAGKKTDVELKGSLGTGTAVKVADLAKDLTTMLDHDLEPLRGTPQ
jgi:hypothetical protein